eukprot:6105156-Ditylum_brightwellii.AAC.1
MSFIFNHGCKDAALTTTTTTTMPAIFTAPVTNITDDRNAILYNTNALPPSFKIDKDIVVPTTTTTTATCALIPAQVSNLTDDYQEEEKENK